MKKLFLLAALLFTATMFTTSCKDATVTPPDFSQFESNVSAGIPVIYADSVGIHISGQFQAHANVQQFLDSLKTGVSLNSPYFTAKLKLDSALNTATLNYNGVIPFKKQ